MSPLAPSSFKLSVVSPTRLCKEIHYNYYTSFLFQTQLEVFVRFTEANHEIYAQLLFIWKFNESGDFLYVQGGLILRGTSFDLECENDRGTTYSRMLNETRSEVADVLKFMLNTCWECKLYDTKEIFAGI